MSTHPDPLLRLLRAYYGDQWSIRRTAHLWVATANDHYADHAPTLVEPDIDVFVRQLESPPARAARPLRLVQHSAG